MTVMIDGIEYVPLIEQIDVAHAINGIYCMKCHSNQTKIYDSRNDERGQMRRRKCLICGNRWKTYEVRIGG